MKKAIIIGLVIVIAAVLYWYFIFSKKTPAVASTTPVAPPANPDSPQATAPPVTTGTSGIAGPADSTIHTTSPVNQLDAPVNNTTDTSIVNLTPAPDLSTLRAMSWSSETYTGSIDPNDLTVQNYLIDFKPVSSPLAMIDYNKDPSFSAKVCSTPSDCSYVNIGPAGFPFKITYGNGYQTYISSDLKSMYFVRTSDAAVIKKISLSTGTVVTQGEGAIVQVVPIAADLNNMSWNVEKFPASMFRYTSDFGAFIQNLNPMFGRNQGVRVIPNNKEDLAGLFCRKSSGNAPDCEKETITKKDFPYLLVYPDLMNNDGSPSTFAYISANQRRVLLAKIIPGETKGTVRIFKEYTR